MEVHNVYFGQFISIMGHCIFGLWCHAPNPGPTRLADPNRFPGRETHDEDSLPFFFLKTDMVPVGMAHIL